MSILCCVISSDVFGAKRLESKEGGVRVREGIFGGGKRECKVREQHLERAKSFSMGIRERRRPSYPHTLILVDSRIVIQNKKMSSFHTADFTRHGAAKP